MLAAGYAMTFGLPDEMLTMITQVVDLLPEQMFRQKIREMGPMMKPFPFNQN